MANALRPVKIEEGYVFCECGEKIPVPENPSSHDTPRVVYIPYLITVECPRCGSEVRVVNDKSRFIKSNSS